MLSGEFKHVLDAKNRIFIPSKFRDELGESFMITRSLRGNYLCFYSIRSWEEFVAPLRALPRKMSEDTLRYLYRTAAEVSPDTQGRIVLPQQLVDHTRRVKNAYVIGCGDYGEIWSEDNYNEKISTENVEELRKALEELGL